MMMEIMLAFALMILFFIAFSTLSFSIQRLHESSVRILHDLDERSREAFDLVHSHFSHTHSFSSLPYGNYSSLYSSQGFRILDTNKDDAYGRPWCRHDISSNIQDALILESGLDAGAFNMSTDMEVRDGSAYIAFDSASLLDKDFFIFDIDTSHIVSSLHTGPGASALELAGPYVYLGLRSTASQVQVIDIHDREHPQVMMSWRVPLPTPTTTPPYVTSLFFYKNSLFVGMSKWNGPELYILDARTLSPRGSFETSTLVNDIYVEGNTVYMATSDRLQMRVLDISTISSPVLISSFSPSGSETQEGKVLDMFEGNLILGRTTGGFNVASHYELFSSTLPFYDMYHRDIPGGVYGSISRPSFSLILTHKAGKEIQVWDRELNSEISSRSLPVTGVRWVCSDSRIFIVTGDSKGFIQLSL